MKARLVAPAGAHPWADLGAAQPTDVLRASVAASMCPPASSSNDGARIDAAFLRDAWALLRLAADDCTLAAALSELTFVGSTSALVLIATQVASERDVAPALYAALLGVAALSLVAPCMQRRSAAAAAAAAAAAEQGVQGGCCTGTFIHRHSLAALFCSVQAYNVAGFYAVLVPSLFYGALADGKEGCPKIPAALSTACVYLGATVLAKAVMRLLTEATALMWRDALTRRLQARYLDDAALYQLRLRQPDVDNPDQRIVREVDSFTTGLATLLCTVFQALFAVMWYSYQTLTITGWPGPLLFYGYFVLSGLLTKLVASPIASIVARTEAAEGSYRLMHVQAALSSEAVAFSGRGKVESASLVGLFRQVLQLRWSLVARHLALNLVTCFFDYAGSIMNYLVIGLAICSGMYSGLKPDEIVQIVSKGSGFAISLVYGFTQIVDCASQASALAGHTRRVAALWHSLAKNEEDTASVRSTERVAGSRVQISDSASSPLVECTAVSVVVPSSQLELLSGVSFAVQPGERLLVAGANGCGKSSLLRVLRGLWPVSGGVVRCVPAVGEGVGTGATCMFMPQTALVLTEATLLDQLAYPLAPEGLLGEQEAAAALELVGLSALSARVGGMQVRHSNWLELVSPGQQQLLALARIFVHRPALVFLDEATSSISVAAEATVYGHLQARGIAVVTVGHRASLEALHDTALNL